MDFSNVGPSECALVALSATTGESLERIQALSDEVAMLAKIRTHGTAPVETVRLLNLLGIQVTTEYYEEHQPTLRALIEFDLWEGRTCGIYCVRSGGTLHAVSFSPRGYVDLLEQPRGVKSMDDARWIHSDTPRTGKNRRVVWSLSWRCDASGRHS